VGAHGGKPLQGVEYFLSWNHSVNKRILSKPFLDINELGFANRKATGAVFAFAVQTTGH